MRWELVGEAASLSAALLWAVAVGLFRPLIEAHGARAINLLKCAVATVLLGLTAWGLGGLGALAHTGRSELILVAASGVVGLTLGDTALFGAVARVGIHRSLLLQTLAPIFTAAIAVGWQGERLGFPELAGGLLVLAGVAVVVAPSRGLAEGAADRRRRAWGTVLGVGAAAGQGVGVVLAKAGMVELSFVPASFLRLASATLGLVLLGLITGTLGRALGAALAPGTLRQAVPATVVGTYVAMLLMMAGIAFAPASLAAVLLATPPVWSLLLEARAGRERITARGLFGTGLAVAGVGVLSAF